MPEHRGGCTKSFADRSRRAHVTGGMLRSLILLLAAACGDPGRPPARSPTPPPPSKTAPAEDDVPVATYMNPALATDGTHARIAELLEARHIRWVAYGSLGFTLAVPRSQADAARDTLRRHNLPIRIIEAAELAQLSAPATPLAPTFAIDRAALDGELADLNKLAAAISVAWNPGGILIGRVAPGSLFARLGLLAGDVIVAVDGTAVRDEADVHRVLQLARSRDRLVITLSRKGTTQATTVAVQP